MKNEYEFQHVDVEVQAQPVGDNRYALDVITHFDGKEFVKEFIPLRFWTADKPRGEAGHEHTENLYIIGVDGSLDLSFSTKEHRLRLVDELQARKLKSVRIGEEIISIQRQQKPSGWGAGSEMRRREFAEHLCSQHGITERMKSFGAFVPPGAVAFLAQGLGEEKPLLQVRYDEIESVKSAALFVVLMCRGKTRQVTLGTKTDQQAAELAADLQKKTVEKVMVGDKMVSLLVIVPAEGKQRVYCPRGDDEQARTLKRQGVVVEHYEGFPIECYVVESGAKADAMFGTLLKLQEGSDE